MKLRLTVLAILGFAGFVTLLVRAFWIQGVGDERLAQLSRKQFISRVIVQPRRGLILDRNGEPLAVNIEAQSLAANPNKIRQKVRMAHNLSHALGLPLEPTLQKLKSSKGFVWIRRRLSDAHLAKLRDYGILTGKDELLDGFWFVRESDRVYPHGEVAGNIIGSVNVDAKGIEGVELWQNSRLEGKGASFIATKDGLERPTLVDSAATRSVRDGEPVQLTLDLSLQFAVEHHLESHVKRTGSRAGTAIVMNAVTGEILALANRPSFNPSDPATAAARRRNRAFTDGFEPGSTLKALLVASALESGGRLNDLVSGNGGSIVIQGKKISEAESHERFGLISLTRLLQVSSNVASVNLALKLGAKKYLNTLREFGIGSKSQAGFPGEISGWIPADGKKIQPLSLATLSFGQGLVSTPIQMIRAYAAFINGGWLVPVSLLKPDASAQTQSIAPQRILSQRVADQMLQALSSVTQEGGTGVKAVFEGLKVAGKTGTAQVVDPKTKRYSRSHFIPSFIGFALNVDPKIVIFTSLDHPTEGYYASETAAPLFRDILGSVANRFNFPRALPEPTQTLSKRPTSVTPNTDQIVLKSAAIAHASVMSKKSQEGGEIFWTMPNLSGVTAREALQSLKGLPVQLKVNGVGMVRSQDPAPGSPLKKGDAVSLSLSLEGALQ
jgi:cell division protein FtsI (penicillin-binding protein 3)